jgi:hypothetical protein
VPAEQLEDIPMKSLLVVLAATAALAGCVVAPYDNRPPPPGPGMRGDRDRDGVPNRYDRDRDGDGVPNRYDNRPGDPRRN